MTALPQMRPYFDPWGSGMTAMALASSDVGDGHQGRCRRDARLGVGHRAASRRASRRHGFGGLALDDELQHRDQRDERVIEIEETAAEKSAGDGISHKRCL